MRVKLKEIEPFFEWLYYFMGTRHLSRFLKTISIISNLFYKLIKVFIAITLPLLICATNYLHKMSMARLWLAIALSLQGGAPVTLLYLFKADTYDTYEIKGDEDNHYLAKGYTDSYELTNENILGFMIMDIHK